MFLAPAAAFGGSTTCEDRVFSLSKQLFVYFETTDKNSANVYISKSSKKSGGFLGLDISLSMLN